MIVAAVRQQAVTMIGFGAIGRSVFERSAHLDGVHITHVVVSAHRVKETQDVLGDAAIACAAVPPHATVVLECAGHRALTEHVMPALSRGVECAILSIGALSDEGLAEKLSAAAMTGRTQLHLLSGAIAGVDALAAAKLAGLSRVTYIGRKPAMGWRGTPADQAFDLSALTGPTEILNSSAREAARLYPKNANVAATIALAGLGLDETRVRLIADPLLLENVHEVEAQGAFGDMLIRMRGRPLPDNPKTSALTVLSAMRFLVNRTATFTL